MGGAHSEVGKAGLGPYLRENDDSCLKKGYTSPLNSSPYLKNQAGLSRASRSNEWPSVRSNLNELSFFLDQVSVITPK